MISRMSWNRTIGGYPNPIRIASLRCRRSRRSSVIFAGCANRFVWEGLTNARQTPHARFKFSWLPKRLHRLSSLCGTDKDISTIVAVDGSSSHPQTPTNCLSKTCARPDPLGEESQPHCLQMIRARGLNTHLVLTLYLPQAGVNLFALADRPRTMWIAAHGSAWHSGKARMATRRASSAMIRLESSGWRPFTARSTLIRVYQFAR